MTYWNWNLLFQLTNYNLSSTRISSLMHLHLVQNIPIPIMIAYIPYAYVMLTGCVWPTIVQFSILLQFTGEKRYIHFVVMDAPQYTTTGSSNIRKTAAAIPNVLLLQQKLMLYITIPRNQNCSHTARKPNICAPYG